MTRRRNYPKYIRAAHRYLGVFIGVQFICWTAGGLYFSWTDIRQIRGDDLRKDKESFVDASKFVQPNTAIEKIRAIQPDARIFKFQWVEILGENYYEIGYRDGDGRIRSALARSIDGHLRSEISEDEARQIASEGLRGSPEQLTATYLPEGSVAADHEYREKPLPAWAIGFDDGLVVYVSAENGQIGAVRNRGWRVFDFLWMLHTLDFEARDNINNYLLRVLSLLGFVTILSGFALFFVSSRMFRRRRP